MNGTSEMPKRNSSNELPPQNAAGKKRYWSVWKRSGK